MSLELTKKIVKTLDDKLARDIEVIKTEEVTIVADYFIIATANSNTHVRALADEIEYQLEHNIKGLVILGSTGEANLLTQKEKIEIVKFVMEKVNGKIPVALCGV